MPQWTLGLPTYGDFTKAMDMASQSADRATSGWEDEFRRQQALEEEILQRNMQDAGYQWSMQNAPAAEAAFMRMSGGSGDLNPAMRNNWLRQQQAAAAGWYQQMRGLQGDAANRMAGYRRDLYGNVINARTAAQQAALNKTYWGAQKKQTGWDQFRGFLGQAAGAALPFAANELIPGGGGAVAGAAGASEFPTTTVPQSQGVGGWDESWKRRGPNGQPPEALGSSSARRLGYGGIF